MRVLLIVALISFLRCQVYCATLDPKFNSTQLEEFSKHKTHKVPVVNRSDDVETPVESSEEIPIQMENVLESRIRSDEDKQQTNSMSQPSVSAKDLILQTIAERIALQFLTNYLHHLRQSPFSVPPPMSMMLVTPRYSYQGFHSYVLLPPQMPVNPMYPYQWSQPFVTPMPLTSSYTNPYLPPMPSTSSYTNPYLPPMPSTSSYTNPYLPPMSSSSTFSYPYHETYPPPKPALPKPSMSSTSTFSYPYHETYPPPKPALPKPPMSSTSTFSYPYHETYPPPEPALPKPPMSSTSTFSYPYHETYPPPEPALPKPPMSSTSTFSYPYHETYPPPDPALPKPPMPSGSSYAYPSDPSPRSNSNQWSQPAVSSSPQMRMNPEYSTSSYSHPYNNQQPIPALGSITIHSSSSSIADCVCHVYLKDKNRGHQFLCRSPELLSRQVDGKLLAEIQISKMYNQYFGSQQDNERTEYHSNSSSIADLACHVYQKDNENFVQCGGPSTFLREPGDKLLADIPIMYKQGFGPQQDDKKNLKFQQFYDSLDKVLTEMTEDEATRLNAEYMEKAKALLEKRSTEENESDSD